MILAEVPQQEWDNIAEFRVDAVWLMGVWERSLDGLAIARSSPSLMAEFRKAPSGSHRPRHCGLSLLCPPLCGGRGARRGPGLYVSLEPRSWHFFSVQEARIEEAADPSLSHRRLSERLEFVNAAISDQREKQPAILEDVRSDEFPVLDDPIVQRPGRAHGSRESESAELELVRAGRCPCAAPSVAVDPHAYSAVGRKMHRILRLVVRHQSRVITPLKLYELP